MTMRAPFTPKTRKMNIGIGRAGSIFEIAKKVAIAATATAIPKTIKYSLELPKFAKFDLELVNLTLTLALNVTHRQH